MRYFLFLCLIGNPARGEIEKLKPDNPQRSEFEGHVIKAETVIPNASPQKPTPQLYRAWRNPSPRTKRPGQERLPFPQIQPTVKKPREGLSDWDKKKWESGKPVRSLEVNEDLANALHPLSLHGFNRLVYKRNRITSEGESRKARQER